MYYRFIENASKFIHQIKISYQTQNLISTKPSQKWENFILYKKSLFIKLQPTKIQIIWAESITNINEMNLHGMFTNMFVTQSHNNFP